jgi:hypothetical protein
MTWAIGVLSLSWEFRKITWIMLSFVIIESSFGEQSGEQNENIKFSGDINRSFETGESICQPKVI